MMVIMFSILMIDVFFKDVLFVNFFGLFVLSLYLEMFCGKNFNCCVFNVKVFSAFKYIESCVLEICDEYDWNGFVGMVLLLFFGWNLFMSEYLCIMFGIEDDE